MITSKDDLEKKLLDDNTSDISLALETEADGDCAFHAALGKWNEEQGKLICEKVDEERSKMAKAIRECNDNSPIFPIVVEVIQEMLIRGDGRNATFQRLRSEYETFLNSKNIAEQEAWLRLQTGLKENVGVFGYIINKTQNRKDLAEFKQQFHHCLNLESGSLYGLIFSDQSLTTLFKAYNTAAQREFGLAKRILENRDILSAYAEFIERPRQWLLPLELKIMAAVFNLNITFQCYNPHTKSFSMPEDLNPNAPTSVKVCFDGEGHFMRMYSPLTNREACGKVLGKSVFMIAIISIDTIGGFINTKLIADLDQQGVNLDATNLINSCQYVIFSYSAVSMYSIGTLLNRAYGAKEIKTLNKILNNGFMFAIPVGIASAGLLLLCAPLLKGLQQPEESVSITQNYFFGFSWGIPAFLCLAAAQQATTLKTRNIGFFLLSKLTTNAMTTGLGYALIQTSLHAAGMGHASSISAWVNLLGLVSILKYAPAFEQYKYFSYEAFAYSKQVISELWDLSWPVLAQILTEGLRVIGSTAIIGGIMSSTDIKANEIATLYITLLMTVPAFGLGQTCNYLCSEVRGRHVVEFSRAQKISDAIKLGASCIITGTGMSLMIITIFGTLSSQLVLTFVHTSNPELEDIKKTTLTLLLIGSVSQAFESIRIITSSAIQGALNDTKYASKIRVLLVCGLGFGAACALGIPTVLGLGSAGVYLGKGIGMISASVLVGRHWYNQIHLGLPEPTTKNESKKNRVLPMIPQLL